MDEYQQDADGAGRLLAHELAYALEQPQGLPIPMLLRVCDG